MRVEIFHYGHIELIFAISVISKNFMFIKWTEKSLSTSSFMSERFYHCFDRVFSCASSSCDLKVLESFNQ